MAETFSSADVFGSTQPVEPYFSSADVFGEAGPKTGAIDRIAIDYANQQAAAGQRTTPIIEAHAKNFLGQATADELGNVGYKDAQGNFVPTDANKHVVLTDPADNTPKVYARTQVTQEGLLSSAGRMLGTMFGPGRIMQGGWTRPALQAVENVGVDVPRAIMTESPITRFAGQVAARAPGGGPLQEAIPRSVQQLGGAVQETAGRTGSVSPARAGEEFSKATTQAFGEGGAIAQQVEQAYDAVGRMVNPTRTQPLTSTVRTVQEIGAQRATGGVPGTSAASEYVMEAATRPEGLTFEGIKTLRSYFGRLMSGASKLPEGMDMAEVKRIYGGLSDDLRTAVIEGGGPRAAIAYERAEGLARGVAQWREQMRRIIDPATRSGENIYEAIVRMAGEGPSANQQALLAARAAVPPAVWSDIAATAISQMGINRAGVFTPAQFLSDYRGLSDVGRRALFGGAGAGNLVKHLDDIAQVSERFVQAGKLANTSGTAGHQVFYTALTGIGGGVVAAMAGAGLPALIAPAAAIGAIVGNNAMARVLAAPATAASMARWASVYQKVAERPTPAGMAAFQRASGELANNLNGKFGIKVTPDQIMRSTVQGPGSGQAGENQQRIGWPVGQ